MKSNLFPVFCPVCGLNESHYALLDYPMVLESNARFSFADLR